MDMTNKLLNIEDIVFNMLENLKSNGTFDEFRRHCISDIDAKPTYQNWKQRIESNVNKFLSSVKYTPELNKNTIRERLRKHLLDGREAHDIEEGADRILTQILAPRTLSIFESKIADAVNEYLGIKNKTPSIEQNGLKESNKNMKIVSGVEINTSVSNPKLDSTADTDNVENIDETSPEFEPLSSVLDNDNSNDESVSGMSDLASVGSPVQLISKENHDTNSNGFESDKNSIEKPQQTLSENGIHNHKNDSTSLSIKPDDVSKILNNSEKLKTNDIKPAKSKHSSKTNLYINTQEKSSSHKSKNHNSSSHRSSSREKNDIKKSNNSSSKDKKSSYHSKHHSTSKDKKHKHDKKSHHSDRDKTPKRDRKDSRSDKKEKSSSLCKEPKSLNGNRSDDDSNAGGSSKQKSNLHKNKSSTSDKSKSSSSNHKSSRKDNSSKEVVDKSKDKTSISKSSNTSSQKSVLKDTKQQKRSLGKKYKLDTDNSIVEEKKSKWVDLRSSITNDEQDAANILLSISEIPYESSHNDVKTENIMFIEDSSTTVETQKISLNTEEIKLDIPENSNQTNIIQSSNSDNVKENVNLKTNKLETSLLVDSFDSLGEKNVPKLNHSLEKVCSVDLERYPLSCKDVKLQNFEIITEHNHLVEVKNNEKEEKSVNGSVNFNSSDINITSEHVDNTILKVPKLKLKRLLNRNDSIKRVKIKKHHKNIESKIKKSKSCVFSNKDSVPVIDTASTTLICKNKDDQESNLDIDIKINEAVNSSSNELFLKENETKISSVLDDKEFTFKGFSQTDSVFCKNYKQLKDLINTLQNEINSQNKIENDGFKGFSCAEIRPCENRHIVHSQLIKLKENLGFIGFSEKEAEFRTAHKYVKEQLELAKKQNNNQQKTLSCGGNGIQNGKKINEVMAILYKNDKDNTASDQVFDQTSEKNKKDCPAVNNNNHDITASDNWVVEQEMKYNLLPVKVKIERLLEYRCNSTKQVSNPPEVPSAPQRSKFK